VLDAGIRGLDALVFTDEEKAEMHKKLGEHWLELQKVLGQETTTQSVTRRVLALLVVVPFVLLVVCAAIAYPFSQPYATFLLDLAQSQFGWLTMGVAAFYFGPFMIQRMLKK
jgi:hypothetical protein